MIRPLNPKARTILKVAIPLAVVAFVLFLWASARPVPIRVQVTFTGFTRVTNVAIDNLRPSIVEVDEVGIGPFSRIENWVKTEAYFCVSNAGKYSVFEEGAYACDRKNQPRFWLKNVRELKGELKPGEFKTVSFEVSSDNPEPLRVSLFFSKTQRRVDWLEKLARNPPRVLRKVVEFIPARWLDHQIEVPSEWIEARELMPVATKMAYTPPTNVVYVNRPHPTVFRVQ